MFDKYVHGRLGTKIELLHRADDDHILELVTPVENRNKGGASQLMAYVCGVADSCERDLTVEAVPSFDCPMHTDQLIAWYMQFGFELTTENYACMIRKANPDREAF